MVSNWTFDASGRELTIHATVKKTGGSCSILWLVTNRLGEMVHSGATSRLSPEGALLHLRTLAGTFGIAGADVADLRAVDPHQESGGP
jgi:hypothetical protein